MGAFRLPPLACRECNGYNRVAAYGRSKLSNLLFTYELQRRLSAAGSATSTRAAHPGVANTEFIRNAPAILRFVAELGMRQLVQSAARGALPSLRAATDPEATGGQYYGPNEIGELGGHPVVVTSSKRSHDTELQQRLWKASEASAGLTEPTAPGS